MKSLLLLFLLVPLASARIGESPEECAKRYGLKQDEPVQDGEITYRKAGYVIHIKFHDGKAVAIEFVKPKNSPGGARVSEKECDALLAASGGKVKWEKKPERSEGSEVWTSEDGKLTAFHGLNVLRIVTAEEIARESEPKKQEKQ